MTSPLNTADAAFSGVPAGDLRLGPGRTLMVQGTASNVGKSVLVTALCRIFRQAGYRVAPFKSQNMSNNSYITEAGEEISRAQGVQAEAAGTAATAWMNPVLLKPAGDGRSQVVILGRPYATADFRTYRERLYPVAARAIREALERLTREYDIVVIEGAGSPAEVNLRDRELVNMTVARWARAPVLLVADIDRGGALAALVGTLELLEPEDRARVAGLVLNKFRGDRALLRPALEFLERRTGVPVLGVIPYVDADVEAEDSLAIPAPPVLGVAPRRVRLRAVHLPRISNFTDLDPLRRTPGVDLRFVTGPAGLADADAVLIPGTKNTAADMLWLRECGLAGAIVELARAGRPVVGLCGGYQMLGRRILDPAGYESAHPSVEGLGLLDAETEFHPPEEKVTARRHGVLLHVPGPLGPLAGIRVSGYEVHMGRTRLGPGARALIRLETGETDGAAGGDGLVWGTYLHDIFQNDALRETWVGWLRRQAQAGVPALSNQSGEPRGTWREREWDRLAQAVRDGLDMERLYRLLGLPGPPPAPGGPGR